MSPSAEPMEEILSKEGLAVTLDYAELPDHVAVELEFMYYLMARASADVRESEVYRERADSFFIEPLAPWLSNFGALVVKRSRHLFILVLVVYYKSKKDNGGASKELPLSFLGSQLFSARCERLLAWILELASIIS